MPRALLLTTLVVSTLPCSFPAGPPGACIAANRQSGSSKRAASSSATQAASRG